jgi:hypothetical protein
MAMKKGFGAFAKHSAVKQQHTNPKAKVNGSAAHFNQELGPLGRLKKQKAPKRGMY